VCLFFNNRNFRCSSTSTESFESEEVTEGELLVDVVVDQLQMLAKHIRKVSMASPVEDSDYSNYYYSSPAPLPLREAPLKNRRSSLKTTRDLITFATSNNASSPNDSPDNIDFDDENIPILKRRSVTFSITHL
jgi:single-stranded DNA-binding protein